MDKDSLYRDIGRLVYETFVKESEAVTELVSEKSIRLVSQTLATLENERLNDFECIERIMFLFEQAGVEIVGRHDFG